MGALALRLSALYAALCFVSMSAVLLISYEYLDDYLWTRIDSHLLEEIHEYRTLLDSQDLGFVCEVLQHEAESHGSAQTFFRIIDRAGEVVCETDMSAWPGVSAELPLIAEARQQSTAFVIHQHPDRRFAVRVAYGDIGGGYVLQTGQSSTADGLMLRHFKQLFFGAAAAFFVCSIFAGAIAGGRSLSRIQRLTAAADDIAAGAWDHRVPISRRGDEIDELAAAFNTMVDRIQVLFKELRDVTDDIAHDLRTPLMRIRGEAELALREGSDVTGLPERYGSVLEECDQMLQLINTMLEISQTEAGAQPITRYPVDLAGVADDVAELFRPAAEDRGIRLETRIEPAPEILGEASRLKRALAHLLDNAIKYTPEGGSVHVRVHREGAEVAVTVADTGIGIPAASLGEVFNRFYRAEASRSAAGNGLGLSLARAIVRAHGGDIEVQSEAGRGATFKMRLPI